MQRVYLRTCCPFAVIIRCAGLNQQILRIAARRNTGLINLNRCSANSWHHGRSTVFRYFNGCLRCGGGYNCHAGGAV
ncbi:MAG: hypothetical protein ACK55Z_18255 [bacterium]